MMIRPVQFAGTWQSQSRPLAASSPGDTFAPGQASDPGLIKPGTTPLQRPLWSEVDRLGLWASCQAISSPLTGVLSAVAVADFEQLIGEFDKAGFKFSDIGDPNQPRSWGTNDRTPDGVKKVILDYDYPESFFSRLTLSQPLASPPEESFFERRDKDVVKQVKIHSFEDLRDAESIFLARDFDRLADPALARRLEHLEQNGVQFRILESEGRSGGEALKNNSSRPVGLYGAYRALHRDKNDVESLWARDVNNQGMYPLQTPEDFDTVEFFALGRSVPSLDQDPLAQRLRDLSSIGLTFHRGDDHDALDAMGAFHALREQRYWKLGVSLDGVGKELIEMQNGGVPQPSRKLLELAEFHHRVIEPDADLSANEKKFYAQGLTWASEKQPLDQVLANIHSMRDFEAGLNPSLEKEQQTRMGIYSFSNLMRALGPDQQPADLVGEYRDLRTRGVKPEVASKALIAFREKLRPQTFDPAEYGEERERILELAEFVNSFDDAVEARKALKMEIQEPYSDRLAALRHLAEVETRHVDERAFSTKTSAVKEALLDYRTLLASPRQSLQSAASLLGRLNDALVPRMGHEKSRDMYDYLQRGITKGIFGPEAVDVFAREFDLAKDVDFARDFLKPAPAVSEPYETRARAAATLRQGMAGLEKPEKEKLDPDDLFGEKPKPPGRDRPSEEYRHLLSVSNRDLEKDAPAMSRLYQLVVPSTSFETARQVFDQMKAGKLGPEDGFVGRLEGELGLTGEVELARRALAGDYPGTLSERQTLKATVADPLDFNLVLSQHRQGERLEDELECLALVHKTLVPSVPVEQSREAFSQLMSSLREGPWTGRPLKEATQEFLRSYALKNDLRHALDNLQLAPQGKSGVQEGERQVIIGGVRIRRR